MLTTTASVLLGLIWVLFLLTTVSAGDAMIMPALRR